MPNDPLLIEDLDAVVDRTRDVWEELRDARIFITGGTGFVGAWLVETAVRAIDSLGLSTRLGILTRRPSLRETPIAHLADHPAVSVSQGDIRSFEFPEGGWTHIIHASAEADPGIHRKDLIQTFDVNVQGTRRCLDLAVAASTKRFLFVSSGAVYGPLNEADCPVQEDYRGAPDPLSPSSAYGQGKRAAEFLTIAAAERAGFEACVARCFAFVGPYQTLEGSFAIANFIGDVLQGRKISVKGDGRALRSYLYASDLAEQLWRLLVFGPAGEAVNVGGDMAISIADLAQLVNRTLAGYGFEIQGSSPPGSTVSAYVPSIAKAQQVLNLHANVELETAIRKTAYWARQRGL